MIGLKKRNSASSLGLFFLIAVVQPACAASFDCDKARVPDEVTICRDRGLNDQDVRVAFLYDATSHFLAMGARDVARDQQKAWLAERRRCGADSACLRRAYARRLTELQRVLEKAYELGPL